MRPRSSAPKSQLLSAEPHVLTSSLPLSCTLISDFGPLPPLIRSLLSLASPTWLPLLFVLCPRFLLHSNCRPTATHTELKWTGQPEVPAHPRAHKLQATSYKLGYKLFRAGSCSEMLPLAVPHLLSTLPLSCHLHLTNTHQTPGYWPLDGRTVPCVPKSP